MDEGGVRISFNVKGGRCKTCERVLHSSLLTLVSWATSSGPAGSVAKTKS